MNPFAIDQDENFATIIKELENAVQNSYINEFEQFFNHEQGSKLQPISSLLDFNNTKHILKEIQNLESETEMQYILEIEEKAYKKFYSSGNKTTYEALYRECAKRIVILTKLLKESLNNPIGMLKEFDKKQNKKEEQLDTYKETIKQLRISQNNIEIEKRQLEIELKDLDDYNQKLEKRLESLEYFKMDEKAMMKLDFDIIVKFEEDCQNSLKKIAKIKNMKIEELMTDIKKSKQTADDPKKCIICNQNNIDIIIKPCNHAILCEECSFRIIKCPLDRGEIISQEKIFF